MPESISSLKTEDTTKENKSIGNTKRYCVLTADSKKERKLPVYSELIPSMNPDNNGTKTGRKANVRKILTSFLLKTDLKTDLNNDIYNLAFYFISS